ncbi:hypothetical protein Nepgr_001427 [Nepenthes gracilis]|uniref:AT-hook motif nuclear-localized protein n=1 Tax=Nepenthes gracilis TaxID=150966 RepID=A0AAD3P748_NEPGR|nr:hypothetical protein Nepgr_001427 [Nepenthes gracilis]
MELNETGLSSFYHPHQPPSSTLNPTAGPVTTAGVTADSPARNGLLPNHGNGSSEGTNLAVLYPHSVAGKAPTAPVETARRKRGRPRKYDTPEAAAAAKRAAASSLSSPSTVKKKKQAFFGSPYSFASYKKSQLASIGNAGQGFTPHVITVDAGEDVAQKIMLFMQQTKRELCVLSASGSVCNASLRQPATSGGNITYGGHFDIITLSGSYVRSDLGGRAGGLSACLSSTDGQIVGGGVGGPLIAAGPVEVIVCTFLFDPKKDASSGIKGDASASTLPSPVPTSTTTYTPVIEPSGRYPGTGADDHQNISGNPFMVQPQGMHAPPSRSTDWRDGLNMRSGIDFDFMGRTTHGGHDSPENVDYDQMPD